jgi:lysozyme family protein
MPTIESVFRAQILPFTLKEEGGLSLDRGDPGNYVNGVLKGTKYGIAARSHPNVDIRHLTVDQASDIYWQEYMPEWLRLQDPALAMVLFDCGVNCGIGEARKALNTALKAHALVDQVATASAANLSYHRSLRTWGRYGKVWGGRIARCQAHAELIERGEAPVLVTPTETSPTPGAPRPSSEATPVPQVGSTPKKTDGHSAVNPGTPKAPTLGEWIWETLVAIFEGIFAHGRT